MSNFVKRKKTSKDIRCLFFPDDVNNGFKKRKPVVGRSKPSSSIKSWERCGEGFLGTPTAEKRTSRKNVKAVRQLVPSSSDPVKGSAAGEVDIVWNSSESEMSDSEMPQPSAFTEGRGEPQKEAVKNSYRRYLGLFSSVTSPNKEEVRKIDWDSDLTDDGEEMDSLAEISDSDSSSKEQKRSPKVILAPDAEISDFSDGERAEHMAQARCEHVSWKPGGSNTRSASDWVRSAQAMLRTPQKQHGSHIKSPEDSAKKKKFLSGGLAERLSRLQGRQRSAISFWRHQSTSDCTTTAVGKAGVLSLKLLSVWEDCGMHVAVCQGAEASASPCPSATGQLLVLFCRDTAGHLAPSPGDTVHVYPQWQKLVMEGENNPVILNTHFSQKVLEDGACAGGRVSAGKCTPYPLTRVFHLMENSAVSEEKLAAKTGESWGVGDAMCDSLLEVIEGYGVAGWMGRDVSVVVQRVYCLHIQEPSSQPLLKHRLPGTEPLQPRYRLCLLVQDAYGLFSEVALHQLSPEDSLQQHIRKWEGSWCVLKSMKVLQRATRARAAGLFSLIDSLWPPMVPLRVHGKAQSSQDDRAKLPAPSFCYLLSAQRGEGSVDELLHPAPGLYLPAVVHTLREILQRVPHGHRCSFTATVIYKRQQGSGPRQSEFWLFVTDPSLQREAEEGGEELNRTVGVCVSSSCVLHPAVLEALSTSFVCSLTFKDAVREDGLIQCVERSVIQLDTLTSAPGSDGLATEGPPLRHPIKLDLLGPAATANSLGMLQGVVVGVDEDTAYSWPVCSLCGSDRLEALHGEHQALFCSFCNTTVVNPTMKMQLEVFLSCASFSQCTIKIKLLQDTIVSFLNFTPSGSEGYTVENVLGKEVGPLATYVRVVTRKPALWVGLEEISLSKGYSNEALQESGPAPVPTNERERI
ncbi:DNA repair-scaffolding protein isoform X1 [Anguilla anguilla]|uniref:DNA repair-scaffolding protein isoform X1 n=1 Tax=Anguilla anguilla TaxID=7936 RepID=UPI0015B23556|nr:DNA repair-scaffolding protein isoform X1 [Anguilla anguilla]